MTAAEGALRSLREDILAARNYQEWKAAGGGGQSTGSIPALGLSPPSVLRYLEWLVRHGLADSKEPAP